MRDSSRAAILGIVFLASAAALARAEVKVSKPVLYTGMCDASAAVALDGGLFAAASDEDSRIRIYHRDRGGPPVAEVDLSKFLDLRGDSPESDLEGAARIGDVVFWISSHGRSPVGKVRANRARFFATRLRVEAGTVQAEFLGQADKNLLEDMEAAPVLKYLNLREAAGLAPKAPGGLNIEGLCATPENHLLIAFRNPIPNGRALVVPLLNPFDVVNGRPSRFGEPRLLDLGGLGIRDMAFAGGVYFIVAGSFDGSGKSRLFEWTGGDSPPEFTKKVKNLNPEAIILYPDKGLNTFQLLSDDGKRNFKGQDCKGLKDEQKRSFRSVWVQEHKD